MFKFVKGVTKRRILMTGLASLLAVVMVLSGITVNDRSSLWSDSSLQIGVGQKVITIGTIAYAAGTADYTCDGIADDAQFQAALDALPATGGKISVLTGNYVFSATVFRAIANVTIEGNGRSTVLTNNNATTIISAGVQPGWGLINLAVDRGWVDFETASDWFMSNIWIVGADDFYIDQWSSQYPLPKVDSLQQLASVHPTGLLLDSFGANWTHTLGTITYDTNIKHYQTRSVKMVTGVGTNAQIDKNISGYDLSNSSIGVWLYTPDYTKIKKIIFYARTTDASWNHYGLGSIIAEGQVPTVNGMWVRLVTSYLGTAAGAPNYSIPTALRISVTPVAGEVATVYLDELSYNKKLLTPHGAVTFSFDDGNITAYTKAKQYFDKYDYGAVWGMMTFSNGYLPSATVIDYAREMQEDGWDIAGHSMTHSYSTDYATEVLLCQKWLADNGFNSEFYLLPGGIWDKEFLDVTRPYLSLVRWTYGRYSSLPDVGTVQRAEIMASSISVATVQGWLDMAKAEKVWLQLLFHGIVDSGAAGSEYNKADLEAIIDYANSEGIEVITYSQAMAKIKDKDGGTKNSGTATIPNGSRTVIVNHGLSTNATGIWLTSSNNETGALYITNTNVSSFTINAASNVTADRDIYWEAIVR